uniref:Ribosome-binding factor A n=1 Tax=Panagrellus redivivus TaxID=6233 RepID=A0A7E4ZUP7_PANRE
MFLLRSCRPTTIIAQSASLSSNAPRQLRPRGRRGTTTTAIPSNAAYFAYSQSKVFTRELMQRFGVDSSLEDAMLVLSSGTKPKTRKLDQKKRKQLAALYFEHVAGIVCAFPEAAEASVIITKVEVSQTFKELKVYWQAFGDMRDVKAKETLEALAPAVRKQLSDALFHSNVPPVVFAADREHLMLTEMNELFASADYGMQYRALSRTGAVLGSAKDCGAPTEEKVAKIPRFVLAQREKRAAKLKLLQEIKEKNAKEDAAHAEGGRSEVH